MKTQDCIKDELNKTRITLDHYKKHLLMCYDLGDWHGVEDAGSDIRDIESKIRALEWVLGD